LRERLAAVLIIPSSWGSQLGGYPTCITPQVLLDLVNPPLVNENHGGDDEDVEDSDDATDQGSTSQGHD
jgi:hypothetical protein